MESKEFRKRNFTLKGRIFYPKLLRPEAGQQSSRLKYSVLFAWPMNDPSQKQVMDAINAHLVAAKQAFFPTIPAQNLQLPIKTWGKYVKKDGSQPAAFLQDSHWMNLSSGEQFKPTVIDQYQNEVIDEAEIYSGRNAVVSFSFYEYNNQNYGMSANLRAVLLQEGGEREATGGVNLGEAFKGFIDESAPSQQTAPAQGQTADTESLI